MNQNKFLLGGLVGGIAFFLFGWVIYGMLTSGMMEANTMAGTAKATPAFLTIFLGGLVRGFLLSYIFERWAGIKSFSGGAAAGTIIGFLTLLADDLLLLGNTNILTNTGAIVDIIAGTVMFALAGGAIGWFLGYKRTAS